MRQRNAIIKALRVANMPKILWEVRLESWCKSRESEQVGFQAFANERMKEMQRFPRFQRRKLLTLSLWMHSEALKDAKLLPEKGKSINVIVQLYEYVRQPERMV